MIKETEVIDKIKKNIYDLFKSTRFLKVIDAQVYPGDRFHQVKPDLILKVETNEKKKYFLVFEVKSTGQPRYVRMAVGQLRKIIGNSKEYYGVFASPFVSEESKEICRENEIGFIDLAGNCFFNFDNVFLSVGGRPNPYPDTRPLKSIFSTISTRALRVLLCNPKKEWFVKDLAKESKISLGQCSLLKKRLLEYELVEELSKEKRSKFQLAKPEELLNKWASNYSYKKNKIKNYYSLDEIKTIEKKLVDYLESKQITYAFTLTSGASLVAPFLRYKRVFSYVFNDIEQMAIELGFKEVSSGQNVSLMEPYDDGIFYGLQEIGGVKIVSDVQLYLDLVSYKERGEEAARFLLEQRLKKQW